MSVKKPIPSLCKHFSIDDEIPEEFLDKTDVDRIVMFTTTFLISPSPSIEQYPSAKFPTTSALYSSCFNFPI